MESIYNIFKHLTNQFSSYTKSCEVLDDTESANLEQETNTIQSDVPQDTNDQIKSLDDFLKKVKEESQDVKPLEKPLQSKRKIDDSSDKPKFKKLTSERDTKRYKYDLTPECKFEDRLPSRPKLYKKYRSSSRERSFSRDDSYERSRSPSKDHKRIKTRSNRSTYRKISYSRSRSTSRDRSYSRSRSPSRERSYKRTRSPYRERSYKRTSYKRYKSDSDNYHSNVYDYNSKDNSYYIIKEGTKIWYKNGLIHRDELPAMICENGTQKWYQYGKYCRENDLPCIISHHGTKIWYLNGRIGRVGDSPAIIEPDGTKKWYKNGLLHRDNGPAIIEPNGTIKWFQNGKLHRDNMPAIIEPNMVYKWYTNGKYNRNDDLPAIININGDLFWYKNGVIHRDNGPAIIRKNGWMSWYRLGVEIYKEKIHSWKNSEYKYDDVINKLYKQFPYLTTWYSWNLLNSEENN
ncbi:hypothetical protein [Moumouvirus maliensis]|nr:hypothetical protein [Moumouvirus maliensis]